MEGKYFLNNIHHFFGKKYFSIIENNLETFYNYDETKKVSIQKNVKDRNKISKEIIVDIIKRMVEHMSQKGGSENIESLKEKIRNKVSMIPPKTF